MAKKTDSDAGGDRGRWRELAMKRLPIIPRIGGYTREDAIGDLVAGVTLGLTLIPQSIAYAALAGLDPQDGLNSSFVGCIIYAFFGSIREVVIGPTSLMALLTYQYTSELNLDFVVLLTFLCGIVEFVMGLLHLGFLVELISAPVVSGFTTATSLIIIVSQMKGLLGLKFKSDGIADTLLKLYQHAPNIRLGDTVLGIACIIILLLFKRLKDVKVSESPTVRRLLWLLSICRNSLLVLGCGLIAFYFKSRGVPLPFVTTKSAETSLPSLRLPPFSTTLGNRTYCFQEMVAELGAGPLVIPVVAVLANVAIAKAFVNGAVDATQEMLTLSLCNVAGCFVQSMPVTGAFTRSAVSSASGVRTPIAGLYTASLVLMAEGFLGPYFHYIPKATLSAILIAAVIFLVDWEIFRYLWKNSWVDLCTVVITLVCCTLVGVEIGLLIGVIVGLTYLIYKAARPAVRVEPLKVDGGTEREVWVRLGSGLYFPGADHVAELVTRAGLEEGKGRDPVKVDCTYLSGSDYTVAQRIMSLKTAFDKRGQRITFMNVPKNCYKLWMGSGCQKDCFADIENGHITGEDSITMKAIQEEKPAGREGEELLKNPSKDHIA